MKKLLILSSLAVVAMGFTSSSYKTVYICTSSSDHAYHINKNCIVLKDCSKDVVMVSLHDAKEVHKRKKCTLEH